MCGIGGGAERLSGGVRGRLRLLQPNFGQDEGLYRQTVESRQSFDFPVNASVEIKRQPQNGFG